VLLARSAVPPVIPRQRLLLTVILEAAVQIQVRLSIVSAITLFFFECHILRLEVLVIGLVDVLENHSEHQVSWLLNFVLNIFYRHLTRTFESVCIRAVQLKITKLLILPVLAATELALRLLHATLLIADHRHVVTHVDCNGIIDDFVVFFSLFKCERLSVDMLIVLQNLTLCLKNRDSRVERLDSWNRSVDIIDHLLLSLALMIIKV